MLNYNPIIVALDVSTLDEAVTLVQTLKPHVGAFKVGLELFNAVGIGIFEEVRAKAGGDVKIFYDAKFHDIPNTVAGAVRNAARNNVWMVNVHASGGLAMMKAAVDAAGSAHNPLLVIAVTVLTSIDEAVLTGELGVSRSPAEQVVALAKLAQQAGCDGVVASPQETAAIRAACGPDFLIVTPGVRPAGAALNDQKRVMTPGDAVAQGASYLVVGRPITGAADPVAAARAIVAEINAA